MATTNEQIMRELGSLAARMHNVEGRLETISKQFDGRLEAISKQQGEFKTSWDQVKGGKKTALLMLSAMGAIGGFFGWLLTTLWSHMKL